jgi:hypothetical protein
MQQKILLIVTLLLACPVSHAAEELAPPKILHWVIPGGWDSTLVFDPKLGSALVEQENGASLQQGAGGLAFVHHSSRPSVQKFFTDFGDRTTIVQGIYMEGITQEAGFRSLLGTAHLKRGKFTSYLSYYANNVERTIIPHLILDLPNFSDDFLDMSVSVNSQNIAATLADASLGAPVSDDGREMAKNFAFREFARIMESTPIGSAVYQQSLHGYLNVTRLSVLRDALDTHWSKDPNVHEFNKKVVFAYKMLQTDLSSAATVGLDIAGVDWDTHSSSKAMQSELLEQLFNAINEVLALAAADGFEQKLLIIVSSNLGRAPKAIAGNHGHWPYTSAMLIGPGLQGGTSIGSTDDLLRAVPINPLFGEVESGREVLLFKHIFAALYLRYAVPYQSFLGKVNPLSLMLSEDDS